LAHNLDFWIPAVTEAIEDEMRTWPIVDTGITPSPVRLNNGDILDGATMGAPRVGSDIWSGERDTAEFVELTVEAADKTGRLRDILDAVRSNRVHDDFSDRWSPAKEDFERAFNHTRSKVKVSFVELEDTTPVHGPETEVIGQLACSDFLALLNRRDREVVVVLTSGATTLTEVGEILGYSNHSAVSKRLARIRDQAVRFFDEH